MFNRFVVQICHALVKRKHVRIESIEITCFKNTLHQIARVFSFQENNMRLNERKNKKRY